MKIAILTGKSARHISFISRLSDSFNEVNVVSEVPPLSDIRIKQNDLLKRYFNLVEGYERDIFNDISIDKNSNISLLELPYGKLAEYELKIINHIKNSDVIIVYGSSYIKNSLCTYLIENAAINIHIGISPYFRGSACNYWAIKFGRYDLIGATIHRLGYGLDSGDIYFHALPKIQKCEPLKFAMLSVRSAQDALIYSLKNSNQKEWSSYKQDKLLEINYSRILDFNESEVRWFFENNQNNVNVLEFLERRDLSMFINPIIL
jgi:hypothetical protein